MTYTAMPGTPSDAAVGLLEASVGTRDHVPGQTPDVNPGERR
jgi:hypothetical protein